MKGNRQFLAAAPLVAALVAGCSGGAAGPSTGPSSDGVSWETALTHALDLERFTRAPGAPARSRLFSSTATTGMETLANLAPPPDGDIDYGFFLRVEDRTNGVDAVLAEMHGAGMITWMWSANPVGELLLYVDDPGSPRLRMPLRAFLDGAFLPARTPLAGATSLGHNLHVPIIHTNFCRVVVRARNRAELAPLYYQVAWNRLDGATAPRTFDPAEVKAAGPRLKALNADLAARVRDSGPDLSPARWLDLAPGRTQEVFSARASGTIGRLAFEGRAREDLGRLDLRAYWDGAAVPAVDCPLHLLLGVSRRMENAASLPATVSGRRATLRWPMPHGPASRVELVNRGEVAAAVRCASETRDDPAAAGRLRFRAVARTFARVPTLGSTVLDLAEAAGAGWIVGCVVDVRSDTPRWWGEGDPIIWIDEAAAPAWRGTGTEDYFGLAWCSTREFTHPFHGQPRAGQDGRVRGTTLYRYHLLDSIPFQRRATFQMEAWGIAAGSMDYRAAILFYAP